MYCKHCGKEIYTDSRFCEYCGNDLESNPNDIPTQPQLPKDSELERLLAMLSGVRITFPELLMVWGYFTKKNGPLYSSKWIRWVKVFLYILITLIIVINMITITVVAWICAAVVFILRMIIVAIKAEHVDPDKRQIVEDINL